MKVTLEVPVSRVAVHPKNPRRNAVADDQLVASVQESGITSPLLVAVDLAKHTAADVLAHCTGQRSLTTSGPWVIALDGHRRRDAAKKAKVKTVPVVIDLDLTTDVDQLKAMILANEYREDLSPVELAESYQGLLDLGLKQADVAKALGRRPRDVSTQLRVLKLAATTQTKVHTGVLTLDDAAGLLEFAGDPETTKKLEAAAESGNDFRYQLQRARQRRDADQETAAKVAELEQAGVTHVEYSVWRDANWTQMRHLGSVPGANADPPVVHDGCHGYTLSPATDWQPSSVIEICTDIAKHQSEQDAGDTADIAERDARIEGARVEAQQRAAESAAAEKVRHDLIRDVAGQDLKISAALEQLLRALLPAMWELLDQFGPLEVYEDLLGLDDGVRVSRRPYGPARDTAVVDHLSSYADMTKANLGRHLVIGLAATADWLITGDMDWDDVLRTQASPYVDLLEGAGYEFAGPDAALRDTARGVDLADESGEAAS